MINLLPPREKIKLLRIKREKITIFIGIIILVSAICLSLILFALQTYIGSRTELQKIALEEIQKEFEKSGLQKLQEKITSTNKAFLQLKLFYEQKPFFSEIIETIYSTLPKAMYLYNLSLSQQKDEIQVSLAGFAPNREVLLELKKNLEARPEFKEIYFPMASWVKTKDIDFFVTFSL